MKSLTHKVLVLLVLLFAARVNAQTQRDSITTAGGNCSVATRCSIFPISRNIQTITVTVTGDHSGATLNLEFSTDNETTYNALPMNNVVAGTTQITSITANAVLASPNYNFTHVRVRASAISSGTASIFWNQGTQSSTTGTAVSGSIGTAAQGAAGVDPWLFLLPTGASTSTKQDTSNTSLASIDNKLPALSNSKVPVEATVVGNSIAAATPILANALSTTVVTVASAGAVWDSYYCYNPNSSVIYVQVFDISGSVTLGTSVPKWSLGIPPTSAGNLSDINLNFANAIKIAATTTAVGLTAPSSALDCNFGKR